jgi:hypothetical protein
VWGGPDLDQVIVACNPVFRIFPTFALFIAAHSASAQAELVGRVVTESGSPIAGATITLTNIRYSVRSDSLGNFRLTGQPGATMALALAAAGYRDETATVVLARRGALTRDFVLKRTDSPEPVSNSSDRIVRGRVMDTDRSPLTYANIQLNGGRRFMADDSGSFSIPVPPGRIRLIVRRIGFAPEEVFFETFPDTAVRVQLRPVAASLPEITISGRAAFVSLDLSGFYERMKDAEKGINHGYFITPEDLDFRKPNHILNMAEGMPAVLLERNILNPRGDIIRGQGGCLMNVYLDGIRVAGKANGTDDRVNELVLPQQVAGMEVYPRAVGAPPKYQSSTNMCGVVLIWSK